MCRRRIPRFTTGSPRPSAPATATGDAWWRCRKSWSTRSMEPERSVDDALESARRRVEAAAERTCHMARDRDREDLVARLQTELGRPEGEGTTVVVAGEIKRGKSSLINGLLDVEEISPVALDVATSAHIVLRHGPSAGARLRGGQEPRAREVPIEELADWATASGSCSGGVRAVDVTLDHPLLADGLVLIDTPGVGGLDAAHAEVTEAALLEADALLFVVDADAPMSGPERRFLERVSERLDSVIFALTKVDKWPGRWEGILERNRQELARLSPRYRDCVWLPVSSKDREEARAARGDDPDWARYMRRAQRLHGARRRAARGSR